MRLLSAMTLTVASATLLGAASCGSRDHKLAYPAAPQDTTVVDNYFGTAVPDPYRPLENDTAAATLAWVEAENKVTDQYLAQIPYRKALRNRLEQFADYEKLSAPWKWYDGKYYFYRNDGLKNQSVIYRADTPDGEAEVFLDPNALSDDGTVALNGIAQSKDGKYTAYTISRSGSDWREIYVMDTKTGKLLDDHILWAKFTTPAWRGDGFYYSAYDAPTAGKEFSNTNEYQKVYYHKIGEPQEQDELVYVDQAHPLLFQGVEPSEDGRYLFLSTSGQGFGNALKMKDLQKPGSDWVTMEPAQDAQISVVDVKDGLIYMLTSADAPHNRLVVAPVKAPQRKNWKDLVAEAPDGVLVDAKRTGSDGLILTYEKDAAEHSALYNLRGEKIRDIEFPTYGTGSFSASDRHDEVFYQFASFLYPTTIYSYDKATGESKLFKAPEIKGFNPEDYVTEQVFYTSKDGTRVPMFLTYKKGIERDGKNPVFLYGYGGFDISLPPSFSPYRLNWLENGGIYAQANLRGGAEYGEPWHEAGTKMKKMNVFDDFIAAGEYLINEGYTSPEFLAINGGSNGGLLVGAVTNLRPDLFAVAVPEVGVMDMMRYHKFTIGWNWASDYGTSEDSPEMASYLLGYSPLHTIKDDGTPYPAILITTADHDDRVVPAHSFKYAATLQAANTGDAPKLIRIDSKAGHGAGKPVSKVLDEKADIYSFIFYNMGITPVTE